MSWLWQVDARAINFDEYVNCIHRFFHTIDSHFILLSSSLFFKLAQRFLEKHWALGTREIDNLPLASLQLPQLYTTHQPATSTFQLLYPLKPASQNGGKSKIRDREQILVNLV